MCQEIVADKRFTREQRDVAVLWISELWSLCERWVPKAPPPIIEREAEDGTIVIHWLWQAKQRSLGLYIEKDESVWLQMLDRGYSRTDMKPTHEVLKRCVQSFFEGWVPNG